MRMSDGGLSVHCELAVPSCARTDIVHGCKGRNLSMKIVRGPQLSTLKN